MIEDWEQLEKKIRPYAEREMQLATYLGIPTEKLDSLTVFWMVDNIAAGSEDNLPWRTELNNLVTLHRLRLQRSRALNSFQVEIETRRPPPGVRAYC